LFINLSTITEILILVPGGLTLREGLTLLEEVHASGCLRGLDLVEVNPSLAKNDLELNQTIEAAKRLILAATGYERRKSAI
jgi:arginase